MLSLLPVKQEFRYLFCSIIKSQSIYFGDTI